jgi:outer membrane protein, adhesin transport system
MLLKPSLITLAVAIFTTGMAWGQSATTLKDAVERAVLKNPEVKVKNENFLAITSEQDSSKGGWRPRVDLNVSGGHDSSKTPDSDQYSGYSHSLSTIQLRQTLFDGHAISSDVRRLGHGRMAAYYDLISTSDQIALETVGAYIDVLRYRELVALAKENFGSHQDVHDRITERTKAGVGRRVDLEQASGRLALAESNWLSEASNLHDVSARFQRLVGEAPATDLNPVPSLSTFLPSRTDFIANTVQKNPDFLSAVSTIRAYRADVELRKSSYWPTLELRLSQDVERNRYGYSGIYGSYGDRAIELVMNYNLYNGGSDSARVKQYAAKLNSAYDLRDKQCRDVRQTSLIALNDVSRLESQMEFLAQHELSTAKAREAYRQQFDIGQRSLLDLLDTENELFTARRTLVNAKYDLQLAKARVLTANDTLLQALELRPLQTEAPPQPEGTTDDDNAMLCSMDMPEVMTLNKQDLPKTPVTPVPTPIMTPAVAPVPVPVVASNCLQITPSITRWVTAWNNKDVNAYLASYSDAFEPAMNLSHEKWVALRRQRVSKPDGFTAVLKDIKQTQCEGDRAEVSFVQEYGSKDYRDVVEKTLGLKFVGNEWKIQRETVTKGRTF